MSDLHKSCPDARPPRRAFTLIELLVVVAIIGLLSAMLLPSFLQMFNAGSDAQAYAIVSGQISAARALAMKTSRYTCVHIQKAHDDVTGSQFKGRYICAVLIQNPETGRFNSDQVFVMSKSSSTATVNGKTLKDTSQNWVPNQWAGYSIRMLTGGGAGQSWQIKENTKDELTLASGGWSPIAPAIGNVYVIFKTTGLEPQALPGEVAFGRVVDPFCSGTAYSAGALGGDDNLTFFTTINIVFSPAGNVALRVDDQPVKFDRAFPVGSNTEADFLLSYFHDFPAFSTPVYSKIWDYENKTVREGASPGPQFGTRTLAIIPDIQQFKSRDAAGRASYLAENCQILPLNVYTGQLGPRK